MKSSLLPGKNIFQQMSSCHVTHHMILHYELELGNHLRKYSGNEVTFKFFHFLSKHGRKVGYEIRRPFKLKSWGVYLHFDENILADESSEENFGDIKEIEWGKEFCNYCRLFINYYLVF